MCLLLCLLLQSPAQDSTAAPKSPVRVYILAGQSNMQGTGFVKADPKRNDGKGSLEYLAKNPATAQRFAPLLAKADEPEPTWKVRDDVWIHYLDRKGRLTAGFGAGPDRIGPELGFGQIIGDQSTEPVLLIKLAWGGKSLAKDFRPPSAGGETGPFYREIIDKTKAVLKDMGTEFPELAGRSLTDEGPSRRRHLPRIQGHHRLRAHPRLLARQGTLPHRSGLPLEHQRRNLLPHRRGHGQGDAGAQGQTLILLPVLGLASGPHNGSQPRCLSPRSPFPDPEQSNTTRPVADRHFPFSFPSAAFTGSFPAGTSFGFPDSLPPSFGFS